jgi:hypothetical protein
VRQAVRRSSRSTARRIHEDSDRSSPRARHQPRPVRHPDPGTGTGTGTIIITITMPEGTDARVRIASPDIPPAQPGPGTAA